MSPAFQNGVEALFHRDVRGNVVDWSDVAKDMVLSAAPIPLTPSSRLRMSDNLASAMGITPLPYRYETEIKKQIDQWRRSSGDPRLMREQQRDDAQANLPSIYGPMRDALRDGNLARAQDELQKLFDGGSTKAGVAQAMRNWSVAPLTGSKIYEKQFKSTLDATNLELYNSAINERRFIYGQFQQALRGANYQLYPEHMEKR
jgi:hypothetical protein